MASDPSQIIASLLQSAGLGSTPNSVAASNIANQGGQLQNQVLQMKLAQAKQDQTRQQQFQAAMQGLGNDPSDANFAALIRQYPDQIDEARKLKAAMDEPARQSHITYFDGLRRVAGDGKPALVTQNLQQMIAAEKAAGHDTSEAEDMLAQVQAGDPAAMRRVEAFAKGQLALLDPAYYAQLQAGAEKPYTLHQGDVRYGADNQQVAAVAAKPEYLVVPEGGMAVPINGSPALTRGGGQASGAGGVAPGSTSGAPRSVRNNNPGNIIDSPFARSQPGYQGSDGRFAIFASPEQGSGAQAALLRSYMDRGINTVGKIISRWAPKSDGNDTGAYVRRVATELGVNPNDTLTPAAIPRLQAAISGVERGGSPAQLAAAPQQGSGPPGTIYGRPKPSYQVLRPDEVPAGLDPNTVYQRSPTGEITPVGGQKQGQLKAWPQTALNARVTNQASIVNIDRALNLLSERNQSPEARAARDAVGLGTGGFGLWDPNRTDPKGADFRALIGQIGGVIIKDISGAAVSATEDDRLKRWVPTVTDSPATIRAKLHNLRNEIAQRNSVMDDTFSEDQGYRPLHPANAGPPQAAIDMLRSKPQLRGAFDAKYGKGAAARVLGR